MPYQITGSKNSKNVIFHAILRISKYIQFFEKNKNPKKYVVFLSDFESVLRIYCRKVREKVVAAAEGRRHNFFGRPEAAPLIFRQSILRTDSKLLRKTTYFFGFLL